MTTPADDPASNLLLPSPAGEKNDMVLAKAMTLPQHQAAVVILDNYTEPQIGEQFRGRGTALFVGLRNLDISTSSSCKAMVSPTPRD